MDCLTEEELSELSQSSVNGTGTVKPDTSIDYGLGVVVTLSVFLVLSMVLALVGNVMVIMTIARHRGMRTRTNLLLANLAVADILVAVLDMPIAVVTIVQGDWTFTKTFCYFNAYTVGLGLMLSVHTLMFISIHKYISITRPFSQSVTPAKIVMMIVAAWTWTIFFNLTPTPIIGWTTSTYKRGASQCGPCPPKKTMQFVHAGINTLVNLVIPIIVMSYCYFCIFKEVKDHLNRMRDFADVSVRNSLIQQKRITETLCIVMSIFILFWTPYIIYSLSLVFLGKENVPEIFNPIAYLFGYMNSACNPIIYALRSPSFRRGFSEMICRNYGGIPETKQKSHQLPKTYDRKKSVACLMAEHVRGQNGNAAQLMNLKSMDCSAGDVSMRENKESSVPKLTPSEPSGAVGIFSTAHREIPITNATPVTDVKPKLSISSNSEIHDDIEETKGGVTVADDQNLQDIAVPLIDIYSDNHIHPKESEMSSSRQRHVSVGLPECQKIVDTSASSSSQPDITAVSWQNLSVQLLNRRISKSDREIIFTTTSIMNENARSVSAGDVRLTEQFPRLERVPFSPSVKLSRHSDVKRPWPLVWQPSVDSLYGSPHFSRKDIFHIKKVLPSSKSGECTERDYMNKPHGKSSVSSCGSSRHLRVTAIINNVKRSFSDLFNLEENHFIHNDLDIVTPSTDDPEDSTISETHST
ncbi:uncharacterized protein [Panulirus ornatus]|uniref:uncharacterized protein isoform X2 n=1 Tax=Panulirus ornatus TaxID=150431 RepID=UPI003A8AE634